MLLHCLHLDIAKFTMWSSVRDPYSVFTLLETIYAAFDAVASRRNVFKVETIGDCYVAGMYQMALNHFASDRLLSSVFRSKLLVFPSHVVIMLLLWRNLHKKFYMP
jgi:Adenylate and Guanylate cyclase catalytic domain